MTATATTAPTTGAAAPPRVVGLDISLTGTGIACSAGWCDAIGLPGITSLPLARRDAALDQLAYDITQHIGPTTGLVVIEAPAYSRSGGGAHERSGLWWRVVHRLLRWDIPVVEVNPGHRSTYATGKGNASKTAVVDAVARRWPAWQTHGDDNAADAVVLMAMGLDALGHPLVDLPKAQRDALTKITWPEVVTR
ncbi:hypothetical protein ABZW11_17025 [Nonomuraea sp. NPDC004580]|uniref:hypothetical protein n=1 Tax=Nonomuraea sp. NPDC004580 TaxID=3154552 RepID=UPI0033A4D0A3